MQETRFTKNSEGHLTLHGVDLVSLSRGRDGPLYVLDEIKIRVQIHAYKAALAQYYPTLSKIYYASKALQNIAICQLMAEEGVGLDASSLGELWIAQQAGFPASHIVFHGNNKSWEEITLALKAPVERIVVDNAAELQLLEQVCTHLNKSCSVLIRINPQIDVATHRYMATGVKFSKFGIGFEEALPLIQRLQTHPRIRFCGLHYHIGSQIHKKENFLNNTHVAVSHMERLHQHGIACPELNLGGGLGVRYLPTDTTISVEKFIKTLSTFLVQKTTELNLPLPHLGLEPGRSIIGEAGCTLYQVGSIKTLPDGTICAAVNGGMTDNIRPCLYQAKYFCVVANKMNVSSPLLLFTTGAYNAAQASMYNKHPLPGMVLVREGHYDWIVKDQPLEDLITYDLPLHH